MPNLNTSKSGASTKSRRTDNLRNYLAAVARIAEYGALSTNERDIAATAAILERDMARGLASLATNLTAAA